MYFDCYLLSTILLLTMNLRREKWFNPAQVYDIIGEIYSVLLCTTYVVSTLLYIKVSFGLLVMTSRKL
jgi:hypothetical protein